jgi:hypothetical protein
VSPRAALADCVQVHAQVGALSVATDGVMLPQ